MGAATEISSARLDAKRKVASRNGRGRSPVTPDDWDAWCRHLQARKTSHSLSKLVAGSPAALLSWPLTDAWHGSESEKLVKRLERFARGDRSVQSGIAERLEGWLDTFPGRPASAELAMEAVAWGHALPRLAGSLLAAPWSQLLDALQTAGREAAALSVGEDPLTQQLLAGELPLTLGFALPELEECRQAAAEAASMLSQGIIELTDGEGLLAARHFSLARPLLACWTRCGYIGRRTRTEVFRAEAQTQLEWFVLQTLRMARSDGSQVMSGGLAGATCRPLLDAALALTKDPADRAIANRLFSRSRNQKQRAPRRKLPAPSVSSEWAEAAVLRNVWDFRSHQLAVTYHDRIIRWELNSAGTTLWSGDGNPEVRVDGASLEIRDPWEEVCTIENEDADYFELQTQLADGRTLQRQMLLARADQFLFVADVVLGDEEAELEYSLDLPIANAITFEPEAETREGHLRKSSRVATVLPLALPEWQSERVSGTLQQQADSLTYRMKTRARRLYAPLFFDLGGRSRRKLTWRRLTVAESLETQLSDVAAGYRVQMGPEQWLFYRSLGPNANRSVLGQNFSCEFVAAQFTPDGETCELVEVE